MAKGVKTGGRIKGTINKKTAEARDRALRVVEMIESKYLEGDIKRLTASQRMILYSDMLEYVVPKLSRTEVSAKGNIHLSSEPIVFE